LRRTRPVVERHVLTDDAQRMPLREEHKVIERFAP
jgi:hypothetical protein